MSYLRSDPSLHLWRQNLTIPLRESFFFFHPLARPSLLYALARG